MSMDGIELAKNAHEEFDGLLKIVVGEVYRRGYFVTCDKRCFACCSEIVSTPKQEAQMLVERIRAMPAEDRARIEEATRRWMDEFMASGVNLLKNPSAMTYRKARLVCPLLKDGLCSVYEHRPISCRGHVALGDRTLCDDDAKRPDQKFVLIEKYVSMALQSILVEQDIEIDHLGVWLAELLLGDSRVSAMRMLVTVTDREGEAT